MEAAAIVKLVTLALSLVENLLPQLKALKLSGHITPAEQQEILDRYNALKEMGDNAFQGPEWLVED